VIVLYPGEGVFDELWARSVYGGLLPSLLRIGVRGEGEPWEESIQWDTRKHPKLPIMSASFTVGHTFPPLTPGPIPTNCDLHPKIWRAKKMTDYGPQ
jgi:hypothetical protein